MFITHNPRMFALLLFLVLVLLVFGVVALQAAHHVAGHVLLIASPDFIGHGH
jgi:hypothetical protein